MRARLAVLVIVFGGLMVMAVPGVASPAPGRDRGLTIAATPNPIIAGDGVLIYGACAAPTTRIRRSIFTAGSCPTSGSR